MILVDILLTGSFHTELNYTNVKKQILPVGRYSVVRLGDRSYFRSLRLFQRTFRDKYTVFAFQ